MVWECFAADTWLSLHSAAALVGASFVLQQDHDGVIRLIECCIR